MLDKQYMQKDKLYDIMCDYILNENMHASMQYTTYQKCFTFHDKKSAIKVLKYLYKNYRKYYYLLDFCFTTINNKRIYNYSFNSAIQFLEENYLYNIYFDTYYIVF